MTRGPHSVRLFSYDLEVRNAFSTFTELKRTKGEEEEETRATFMFLVSQFTARASS